MKCSINFIIMVFCSPEEPQDIPIPSGLSQTQNFSFLQSLKMYS